MAETNGPGAEPRPPLDPAQLQAPGGCGVVGCLTAAMVLAAVLLTILVVMAILRPGMAPLPQVPR